MCGYLSIAVSLVTQFGKYTKLCFDDQRNEHFFVADRCGDLRARAEREPPIRQKDGQQIAVCKNETQRRRCSKDLARCFTSTQLNSFGTKQHMQFDCRRTHQKYSI